MCPTIRDRLSQNVRQRLIGRRAELDQLHRALAERAPAVMHLHGLSGVGKSALLSAFAEEARAAGVSVLAVECGSIEPTERGLLKELGQALSCLPDLQAVAEALAADPKPVLLTFDTYELFGLLDAWMRQRFVPALPAHTLVLLASRLPPAASWTEAPEWQGLFRAMPLDMLSVVEATALLEQLEVPHDVASRIICFVAGHPLALTLAARAAQSPSTDSAQPLEVVIPQLARRYLGEVADGETREALRAASIARRISIGLLRALRPQADPSALYDRLAALPFVTGMRDGLALHETVREAVAAELQAADPELHRRYRQDAWHQLSREAQTAPAGDLWRCTADLIHLMRNPVIREAFFPHNATRFAVEPAQSEDRPAILAMTRQHDGVAGAALMDTWMDSAPQAFFVARAPNRAVEGFYCLLDALDAATSTLLADPMMARFMRDVSERPLSGGQTALFLRRWMGRVEGERPSAVQAACWLDIKRHYMERRPQLRRVYMALNAFEPYSAVATSLGIIPLPDLVVIDNRSMQAAVLDMGPGSVDGWLIQLAARELGIPTQDNLLDTAKRALRVDGQIVPLTRREFDVMAYLVARRGEAVSRDCLIHEIWALRFDPGSNVVDAVVASLRRKLGNNADVIETVRGFGYVYRAAAHGAQRPMPKSIPVMPSRAPMGAPRARSRSS